MHLQSLARSYLQAGGYQVRRESPGFLDLAHPEASKGRPARILLWSDDAAQTASRDLTATQRSEREKRERALMALFSEEMGAAPGAVGYYLVPSRLGFSAEFIENALPKPGGVRVPIQFFDTDYRVRSTAGRGVRSVVGGVLNQAEKMRRVAQPFSIRRGLGPGDLAAGKADLVEHLETVLMDPGAGAKVRFIDGAAGSGKTVAFNALLHASFNEFIEAKKAQAARVARRRPIAFLPDHIRDEAIGYVDDVLDAAVEADMAEAVEPEQLRWLLKRGFVSWMFDGLDEFYAGDNDFFAFLEEELADPQSQAQILVCTRDSLFSSSEAMRAFIERQLRRGTGIEIYELAPWNVGRWAQLAWLELEQGRKGAEHSDKVRAFVRALEGSDTLADLAKLPFYCSVMIETFKADKALPKDEFALLQSIVDRMVEREHGKDIFRWQDFVDVEALSEAIEDLAAEEKVAARDTADTRAILAEALTGEGRAALFELIEALAHDYRRNPGSGAADGFKLDDLRNFYGRTYASSDLADADVGRLTTVLVQFAFFGRGRHAGSVDFTHHILADYLAARYAVALLRNAIAQEEQAGAGRQSRGLSDVTRRVSAMRQAIGTAPFVEGSLFHRYIAQEMGRDAKLAAFVGSLDGADLGRANVVAAVRALARHKG
jgi:hypothetical protein